MKATNVWPPLGRSRLAALIVIVALLGGCTQASTHGAEPNAAPAFPGRADAFSWYWDEVAAVPGERGSYSIEVRFTNVSDHVARVPDCWAIPGPGRAGAIVWEQRPVVEPGETTWATGTATFARRIPEIDEVVCDRDVAESYRR